MGDDSRRSEATNGFRKAIDFWDFIDVHLYSTPRYILKDMEYYIWSEKKGELQKHRTTEALTYQDLEPFIKKELVWLPKK